MPHKWVGVGVVFSISAAIIHSLRGRALIRTNTHELSEQHWGPDGRGSVGGPSSLLQVTLGLGVSGAALCGAPAPSTAPQRWCLGQGTDKQLWYCISKRNKLLCVCIWAAQLYFRAARALQQWQANISRQAKGKKRGPDPLCSLM